jgi:anthraniloyl-CoA monooxygenase
VQIARRLAEAGCGLIHVAAGQTISGGIPEYRRSYLTPLADRIRSQAGVPTLVGGYMTTVDEINTAVGSGRADLCLLELESLAAGPAVANVNP